jgi:hypothetical protein
MHPPREKDCKSVFLWKGIGKEAWRAAIVRALHLSNATMNNIRQNLFFAFVYNAAGVPIAAGLLPRPVAYAPGAGLAFLGQPWRA